MGLKETLSLLALDSSGLENNHLRTQKAVLQQDMERIGPGQCDRG